MTEVMTYGYSDPGGRELNEDFGSIFRKKPGIISAVVADGLGGHGGGDKASSMVVRGLKQYLDETEEITEGGLDEVLSKLNEEIYDTNTKMKSTVAGVFIDLKKKNALLFHVGDTRIYHLVNGKIESVSIDHSVSQMAVYAGEITQDQIRHHADRNKLLRAMGGDEEVSVEYRTIEDLSRDDHCFLLCSDGFWEHVLEQEMEDTYEMSETPKDWIGKMREILENRVRDIKNDNHTAAAVWLIRK